MLKPFLRAALPAILLGACALPLAHADIYTWTDETGRVNISNLTPPDGARVTRVMHEDKAVIAALDTAREAAREALREAEVRALAERVRQLQNEVELAKRRRRSRSSIEALPAPPIVQYIPPPEASISAAAPPVYTGAISVSTARSGGVSGSIPATSSY